MTGKLQKTFDLHLQQALQLFFASIHTQREMETEAGRERVWNKSFTFLCWNLSLRLEPVLPSLGPSVCLSTCPSVYMLLPLKLGADSSLPGTW